MDLFNYEIVAWKMSRRNDYVLVKETVSQLRCKGAILHSDQGYQYTTRAYDSLLNKKGIQGSHSRRGNCYDNACIESFFSHLKTEKVYLEKPQTLEAAETMINEYIRFYNNKRFQKKLGDRSPEEYRLAAAS